MRKIVITILSTVLFSVRLLAQPTASFNYEKVRSLPTMRWVCPEINKYQGLLASLKSDDYKTYANRVKEQIEPYSIADSPDHKYLLTTAVFTIENPMFDIENLNAWLVGWLKKKEWAKKLKYVGDSGKVIQTTASFHVSSHSTFGTHNEVIINPTLTIHVVEGNKLFVTFSTDSYKYIEKYSDGKTAFTRILNVGDMFPLNQKSLYKISMAKAYVGTYLNFWNTIADLGIDLNKGFSRDTKLLSQLQYSHSKDSLIAKYGEPEKVIAGLGKNLDIHNEMYIFEQAQKVVFMGKTIGFKDILSCKIIDDPQFIPGKTTTGGIGFSIFGMAVGGGETKRTADKTIHNYVVDIKIDNLSTPFIRIATGQNEYKATEIASVFEYILRHHGNNNPTTSKSKDATKRTRR